MRKERLKISGRNFLHIRDAATLVGVSGTHLRKACASDAVLCRSVGGAWYVSEEELHIFKAVLIRNKTIKEVVTRIQRKEEREMPGLKTPRLRVGSEIVRRKIS